MRLFLWFNNYFVSKEWIFCYISGSRIFNKELLRKI